MWVSDETTIGLPGLVPNCYPHEIRMYGSFTIICCYMWYNAVYVWLVTDIVSGGWLAYHPTFIPPAAQHAHDEMYNLLASYPGLSYPSVCCSLCMCLCVSVTALVGATSPLKAKIRYQQKALDPGNKRNIGIELKVLGSKVMTVISLPWNLHLALMAGNQHQQVASAVRRWLLVLQY